MNYKEYLLSDHWKKTRKRLLESKRFKGKCKVCCNPLSPLLAQVHHKTYKNLWKENLRELEALCAECHKNIHFENGVKLKLTPQVLNNRLYKLIPKG